MKITIREEGKIAVSDGGVGLFFEDLNYALDGGLYAEMLENQNFEAKTVCGERNDYRVASDGLYGWTGYPAGAEVALKLKSDRPLFAENPHYLRLTAGHGRAGVKNRAYGGICLVKGMRYTVSFYLRSYDYKEKVSVGVYREGHPLLEKAFKVRPDGKWKRYNCCFKSRTDTDSAEFVLMLQGAGTVHVDCFSMMPENAVKGVFRRDLAEMMREVKPKFLRFPGGCVVEGNSIANRYLWKKSVGPRERRTHNWNRWAVHAAIDGKPTQWSHYGQTLGVGYYEYFLLCEYLGAKPLPVLSVGIACQYMSDETVPLDDPEMETYVQDALDLIEFANGAPDTEWGSVRAEMGHPQPFGLEYLGIGNEQWETETNCFYRRYERFEKRIHERYPEIKLIGTVGPTIGTPSYEQAWQWTRERLAENPVFVYASDEHVYAPPSWFFEHSDLYDSYPRGARVYVGEYAAHVPGKGGTANCPEANTWECALSEAAFMTGMERNADVVVMASYAPLFGRLGDSQWSPCLAWFDGKNTYATANYYVQEMFSFYTGNYSLRTEVEGGKQSGVYASATEREGLTYVKVVNATDREIETELDGNYDLGSLTYIIRMEGELSDYNHPGEEKLVPQEIAPTAARSLTLSPHSFSVLVFRR